MTLKAVAMPNDTNIMNRMKYLNARQLSDWLGCSVMLPTSPFGACSNSNSSVLIIFLVNFVAISRRGLCVLRLFLVGRAVLGFGIFIYLLEIASCVRIVAVECELRVQAR